MVRVWPAGCKEAPGLSGSGPVLRLPHSECLPTSVLHQLAGLAQTGILNCVPYSLLEHWDGPAWEGRMSSGKGFFLWKKKLSST